MEFPLTDTAPGDVLEAARVNAIQRMAAAAAQLGAGPGVRIDQSPSGQKVVSVAEQQEILPGTLIPFIITGERDRGGCYEAFILVQLNSTFDETFVGELDGAIYTQSTDEITAVNFNEQGSPATHYLTHALNSFQNKFLGRLTGHTDTAGRRVVHFNGVWQKPCTPP